MLTRWAASWPRGTTGYPSREAGTVISLAMYIILALGMLELAVAVGQIALTVLVVRLVRELVRK